MCPDHAYSSSSVNFYDGVGFHFFKNREAPEKPAEVFAVKRAQPTERRVRQKVGSRGEHPRSALGDDEREESVDLESGTELVGPGVFDKKLCKEGSETKDTAQPKAVPDDRRDGDEPGHEQSTNRLESRDEYTDGGRTRPTVAVSNSSEQLVMGWSELLMVDVVLAYFRYYAHKRKGYAGRTFNHRSQVCCSS